MKSIIEPKDRIKSNYCTPFELMEQYHSSEEVENALRQRLIESNIEIKEVKTYKDFCDIATKDKKVIHYLMNIGYWIIMEKSPWLNDWLSYMRESFNKIFINISDTLEEKDSWVIHFCLELCPEPFFIKNKKGVALWEIMLKKRFVLPTIYRFTFGPLLFLFFLSLYIPPIWQSYVGNGNNLFSYISMIIPLIAAYLMFDRDSTSKHIFLVNLGYIGAVYIVQVLNLFFCFQQESLSHNETIEISNVVSNLVYWAVFSFILSIIIQFYNIFSREYDMIAKGKFTKLSFF